MKLGRAAFAEFLGTAGLLAAVIGSGIMAERLAGGNVAVALLANTLVTVAALYVLIEVLGPVSGAHFNPVVTLVLASRHATPISRQVWVPAFLVAQAGGAIAGAWLAHAMFGLDIVQVSTKVRSGPGQWLAEAVATAGLLLVILRAPAGKAPALVACNIGAAYWFTASTSFANPAAVLGRMLSDSFAGIAPASAPAFVLAQVLGGVAGLALARALGPAGPGEEGPAPTP
jgi:glycerol uptake facilitator-like aquaporin